MPLFPGPSNLGHPRTTNLRNVVNAVQYIAVMGCQWRLEIITLSDIACGFAVLAR
ncbi:MAG: transposase [Paracoccaceae bacterium]|jgi:transposase